MTVALAVELFVALAPYLSAEARDLLAAFQAEQDAQRILSGAESQAVLAHATLANIQSL